MTTARIHILLPARCRSPAEAEAGAAGPAGVLMWCPCPGALEGGIENGDPPKPAQLGQVVLHSISILLPRSLISLRHLMPSLLLSLARQHSGPAAPGCLLPRKVCMHIQ